MEEGVRRRVNLLPLLPRTDGSSEVELMEAGFMSIQQTIGQRPRRLPAGWSETPNTHLLSLNDTQNI